MRERVSNPILNLFKTVYQNRKLFPFLLIVVTFSIIFNVFYCCLVPIITKNIFDNLLGEMNVRFIFSLLAIQFTGIIILIVTDIFQSIYTSKIAIKMGNLLRFKLYGCLQYIEFSAVEKHAQAKMITHYSNDIEQIEFIVAHILFSSLRSLLFILPGIVILIYFNWMLALIILMLIPVTFLLPRLFSAKVPSLRTKIQRTQDGIITFIQESIVMQVMIRLLLLDNYKRNVFKHQIKSVTDSKVKYNYLTELTGRTTYLVIIATRFITVCLGVNFVIIHRMTIGSVVGFIDLLGGVNYSIALFSNNYTNLLQGGVSLKRIQETMHHKHKNDGNNRVKNKIDFNFLSRSIKLQNVNFNYDKHQILKSLNFEIFKNQYVAFVGPSGSGKSTLLKLLLLQVKPQTGQIFYDGIDSDEIKVASFLEKIGVVLQHPMLFNGSIKDNIRMGKLDATDEEIMEAAKLAEIHQDIMNFSEGYDTQVGSLSNRLSGGQSQRISIARALIKKPNILFLDEATASLDLISATAIDETFMRIAKTCTIISITHRLSSVTSADKIFVIKNGRLVESGTHEQLLNKKREYKKLWSNQHGISVTLDSRNAHVSEEWLRSVPIFAKLSNAMLALLTDKFFIQMLESDRILFNQGDHGDKFYVIVSGIVELSYINSQTRQRKIIGKLSDGDFFGEIALLKSVTRTARVETKTACIFLYLTAQQFSIIYQQFPEDLQNHIKETAQKRSQTEAKWSGLDSVRNILK